MSVNKHLLDNSRKEVDIYTTKMITELKGNDNLVAGGGHVVHPGPLLRAGPAAAQLAAAELETGVAHQHPGGVSLVSSDRRNKIDIFLGTPGLLPGARPARHGRPVTVLQPAVVARPGLVWTRVDVGGCERVATREPGVLALWALGVVAALEY